MLIGTHSLASIASVFIDALEKNYGIECAPLLEEAGLDVAKIDVPGARYSDASFDKLWTIVLRETGDECVGLVIGERIRVTTFHALGFAWMASDTFRDAFSRLARYDRIVSTGAHLKLDDHGDFCRLTLESYVADYPILPVAAEAYFMAILKLCREVKDASFAPAEVRFARPETDRADDFAAAFNAPVRFGANDDQLLFERTVVDARLPGRNAVLALANDRVAESYLGSLDTDLLATRVRELMIQLLPSGGLSQERIAKRLNCSPSTLHRRLVSEGTTFRRIRDDVRKELALRNVRHGKLSLSEIAFLVGFSDQSNFSRAFRRWTGSPPREYSKRA